MKELLIISLVGIAVLAADILKLRKVIFPLIVLSLTGLVASCVLDWGKSEVPFSEYGGMLKFDNLALAFTMVLSIIGLLWFVITSDYFSGNVENRTDLYALVLFSMCGAVVMASFSNLMMLFLGLEILSIPLYVLASSEKRNILSNEAGFKYFFLGSLASAIILFGIALVYGATGTFDLASLSLKVTTLGTSSALLMAGVTMIVAGFAFKISVAPFHLWAPDVYQGAPVVFTAFMATIVKAAAFAALYKLFSEPFRGLGENFTTVLAIMSATTLIVANVIATVQVNSKRLLAYSSVSHAGFMLGFVMISSQMSGKYLLFYTFAYSVASLTAFGTLHHISKIQMGEDSTHAFRGLVRRNPIMAGAMTLALFSMAGIPPLSGFLAKYYVIKGVVSGGHLWLVVVMILSSVVAMYYYLKIIIAMFTPIENAGRIVVSKAQQWTYGLFAILLVALFFGAGILEWVQF